MKSPYKTWAALIRRGDEAFEKGDGSAAIRTFKRAQAVSERLIDETIFQFDGETQMLNLFNYAGLCLIDTYLRLNDSASAEACLETMNRKFLTILKNPVFPVPIRGKTIREFELLFNAIIEFYQSIGRPERASPVIEQSLAEIRNYVAALQPMDEVVRQN